MKTREYCSLPDAVIALEISSYRNDLIGNYHIATLQSYLAGQTANMFDKKNIFFNESENKPKEI